MNVVVLVKQVPDTTVGIKIAADGTCLEKEGLAYMANPLDLVALEEAVRIRERCGSGNMTVLSMGPPGAEKILRKCIAQGADRAILVSDAGSENSDGYVTASVLSQVVKSLEYDLILCGARAVDTNGGQVGTIIGEMIGIDVICGVTKIEVSSREKKLTVQKKVEHGNREVIVITLPALVTVELGLNEPRYPDLPSIIRAQRAEIERINRVDLDIDAGSVSSKGAGSEAVRLSPPKPRPKKIFTPPSDVSLVQFLKQHKLVASRRSL